jgi:hypothetical protein
MDGWRDQWAQKIEPFVVPNTTGTVTVYSGVSRQDFEAFKAEMRKELNSLKKLLKAAKIYDEESGQADCENADKIALFKQLAELCGVSIQDIFPEKVV